MGSGASRQALLQRSGSRLDALLTEARNLSEEERQFERALEHIPPGMRVDLCNLNRPATERPKRPSWCHEETASLHEAEIPATEGITSEEADEKSGRDGQAEEEEEGYSTDDFEDDEVTEWKKGASIGSGSYGTVREDELLGCCLAHAMWLIGCSCMQVYLARDEETGSLMAVKEILISEETDAAIREATREVDLLRCLKHENIVKYMGCHVDSNAQTLSIFTEWVPGGSLEHNRRLFGGNERVVRRFTHQLLSGVAYLHSKNIIHNDIKPANILVDQNAVHSKRSLQGTPNYIAPAMIKSSGRSRKADIWSIGCTVLRLLTGGPLWGDRHFDSQAALLYYIANLEEIPSLPDGLSPEARELISACLQIDPSMRPSAAEFTRSLNVQDRDQNLLYPNQLLMCDVTQPPGNLLHRDVTQHQHYHR
ncbi:LOW QUALITY PROTEIN: STE/STE11 protein kinase [Phytophthora palmivora]|uniref:STE/STE11 protein kinase n=1 Tax=Phytophthora palmivora TaxID=4796 RepID=A0A2P4YDU1_9STRA|nr:LOW QUALITY PROTEIN: STE/STE11 protein kinase [Phytophthora palmivora]